MTKITQDWDPMEYAPEMEQIDSAILEEVLRRREEYDYNRYTAADVRRALDADHRTPEDFAALLSLLPHPFWRRWLKKPSWRPGSISAIPCISLPPFTSPTTVENYCVYCGFNCHNKIRRAKLDMDGIRKEMEAIAKTGLEEILILTGESRKMSDVDYIADACRIAREYFKMVGVEVYPMNSDEYRKLRGSRCGLRHGVPGNLQPGKVQQAPSGRPQAGVPLPGQRPGTGPHGRNAGCGLCRPAGVGRLPQGTRLPPGCTPWLIQRKYPHAEISFSCPRLRPIINNDKINPKDVHEPQLLQVMTAYRLFMPFAGMTISTRECARFRDHVIGLAATKISAGVSTGIGSHAGGRRRGRPVRDQRYPECGPGVGRHPFSGIAAGDE